MDLLRTFYNDEHTREAVKAFFIVNLEELTIERVFKKESVEGIHEANELVERAFKRLSELYQENPKVEFPSNR